ncbi:MAG: cyclic pyranopterin monophosphate synthase MoaC [Desulfosudaceae bacterium]
MADFTHLDEKGQARMVDVGDKEETRRVAVATGAVQMSRALFDALEERRVKKGNVLETARVAGIMAAKRTADLVPMCHPLNLTHVAVDFYPDRENNRLRIEARAETRGRTGVEMEAITAVSVAALTVYDMCKSHDKRMVISDIHLEEKQGGKSGHFRWRI